MRKIVAGLFVSLDGVVEAPETWHFPYFNDEMGEIVASQMAAADTMLLGRRTYEEFAAYWADKGSEVDFADQINNTPKLVASTTLESVGWQNSTPHQGRRRHGTDAPEAGAGQGHLDHRQRHPCPVAAPRQGPR